jgi:peroxiredoxin
MRFLAFLLGIALASNLFAADVASRADQVHPLLIGAAVPDVGLRDIDGNTVSLRDVLGGKPTALIFYRGGWCPFCNLQLSGLRTIQKNLSDLGYQVIAVSPDRPEELRRTLDQNALTYRLLSDSGIDALKAFGIAFRVDDETFAMYREHDVDLEKFAGASHHVLPVPSVFVIDAKGTIQFEYVNPDYKVRVPQDVLLAAAVAVIEQQKHAPAAK